MKPSEILLESGPYQALRASGDVSGLPSAADVAVSLLVREAEGGRATGRWMVLGRCHEVGRRSLWGWPPVASSDSRNDAAARLAEAETNPMRRSS